MGPQAEYTGPRRPVVGQLATKQEWDNWETARLVQQTLDRERAQRTLPRPFKQPRPRTLTPTRSNDAD